MSAAAQTLDIELNKLEDAGGQCVASLLLTNRLRETLEQVRFDLYVMDTPGKARQKMEALARAWRLSCRSYGGVVRGPDELVSWWDAVTRSSANLMTVHLTSSVRMG